MLLHMIILAMLPVVHGAMVDLTYPLNKKGIYFPQLMKLEHTVVNNGTFEDAPYSYMGDFYMSEHIGTHVDAPVHYALGGRKLHELMLDELHGQGVVIDIREKAKSDPNALVTREDVMQWEKKYGQVPKGAIIIQYSGWGKYWGDPDKYVGPQSGQRLSIVSPGIDPDLVYWLLNERDVHGFVVDSRSCDAGINTGAYPSHRAIMENDKWCVENGANLELIPEHGSEVYVMPAKIENASGGPVRMFAIWDEPVPWHNANAASYMNPSLFLLILMELIISYVTINNATF